MIRRMYSSLRSLGRGLAATLAILLALLAGTGRAAADGLALPVTVRHDNITVRAEAGLDDLAEDVAAWAPASLAKIAADLPDLPTPPHVEIRLVVSNADLGAASPRGHGTPEWAAGVAYPEQGVVVVATRRVGDPIDVRQTVIHELAHLALGAALRDRAPRWLDEGFANLHSAEWTIERTQTLAGMAWFDSTIPLADLEWSFPAGEIAAGRAYAESYDFVAFLARRGRWDDPSDDGDRWPLREMLRRIADGADPSTAASRAYGRPLNALFDEWKVDLRGRFMFVPAGLIVGGLWLFGALLLVLGWWRRRRQNERRLARWGEEERASERARTPAVTPVHADASATTSVAAPPFVAWPGQRDPLRDGSDDGDQIAASHPEVIIRSDDVEDEDDDDDDDGDDERPDPPDRRWLN